MSGSQGGRSRADDDAARIVALEARVQALESELAALRTRYRATSVRSKAQAEELKKARQDLAGLRARRSVHLILAFARRLRAARARSRRLGGTVLDAPRSLGRRWRRRGLVRSLQAQRPRPATEGPLVTIVVTSGHGEPDLGRCLRAIARTTYRNVEILVIDEGPGKAAAAVVKRVPSPFHTRVVRQLDTTSLLVSDDAGSAPALGDSICLLGADVEPVTGDWLGFLVETQRARGADAVGARLLHPLRGWRGGPSEVADLTVQHQGLTFDRRHAVPMPRLMGAGEDPTGSTADPAAAAPAALSAACLLLSRAAIATVTGAALGHDDGLQDGSLSLHLRAAGMTLAFDGRAALWHHGADRRRPGVAPLATDEPTDPEPYLDTWSPRIHREALLDALDGSRRWSTEPLHVAILGRDGPDGPAGPAADTLPDAGLAAFGWRVSRVPGDDDAWYRPDLSVDALLVADAACDLRRLPRGPVSVAWLGDAPERWLDQPWFDDFDVVFAPAEAADLVRARSAKVAIVRPPTDAGAAEAFRAGLLAWVTATRFGLRTGVPGWDVAESWGDYHFARAVQRALERAGRPTRVHFLPAWTDPVGARDDVSVHLFGLKEAPTRAAQVNLLWHISHPDLASPQVYARYDHVFVASDRFAARMTRGSRVPVQPLHQATDPERFRPEPGGPPHELLFVANSRNVQRKIVADLAGTSHDLAIYGRGWGPSLIEPRFVRGEGIPNAALAPYYTAAAIVLNDHWDDMRAEGFISNRIYDALACGAYVISDFIEGIDEEFGGAVVTYRERTELMTLIDQALADPDERHRRGELGRAAVLERHTFEARARVLVDVSARLLRSRSARIETGAQASPSSAATSAANGN